MYAYAYLYNMNYIILFQQVLCVYFQHVLREDVCMSDAQIQACLLYTLMSVWCEGFSVLCFGVSLCNVWDLVCISVFCLGFGLRCAHCSHECRRFAPSKPRFALEGTAPRAQQRPNGRAQQGYMYIIGLYMHAYMHPHIYGLVSSS